MSGQKGGRSRTAPIPGWVGWLGLSFYVAGWDFHPHTETMSSYFCPVGVRVGRKGYVLAWVLITLHLTRILPARYDPLRRLDLLKWKAFTAINQGGQAA